MFGLFRRTKIENWEIGLLLNVVEQLPIDDSQIFARQIREGLFRGVIIGLSDIPDYIGFSFNPKVHDLFFKKNERNYKLSGIKLFNVATHQYLKYSIYVSFGIINGYSIEGPKNRKLDITEINVSNFVKVYMDPIINSRISDILSPTEKKSLNPSQVYSVEVNNREYFHIKDLEDGDFIGFDLEKKVYKVTHDPMKATLIHNSLADFLIKNN